MLHRVVYFTPFSVHVHVHGTVNGEHPGPEHSAQITLIERRNTELVKIHNFWAGPVECLS